MKVITNSATYECKSNVGRRFLTIRAETKEMMDELREWIPMIQVKQEKTFWSANVTPEEWATSCAAMALLVENHDLGAKTQQKAFSEAETAYDEHPGLLRRRRERDGSK
jgi:hypothetical protein